MAGRLSRKGAPSIRAISTTTVGEAWQTCVCPLGVGASDNELCSENPAVSVRALRGRGFENYAVALAFQGLDCAAPRPLGLAAVIVVGTRIVVGRVVGEQMVDRDEHGVGDSDDGVRVPAVVHD